MSSRILEFEPPPEPVRNAYYGKTRDFEFWLKNAGSDSLVVESVTLHMQPDDGWTGRSDGLAFRRDLGIELAPSGREHVSVPILPPLYGLGNSNYMNASAQVRLIQDSKFGREFRVTREQFSWVMLLEPAPAPGAEVFISFADPEDLALAQLAKTYLIRTGLTPYLAREDTRPGCDMWSDKIEPAIRRAIGTLVIWTPNTVAKSDSVRREIRFSQRSEVPVALFRGANAETPRECSGTRREYVRFDPAAPQLEFASGIAGAVQRWKGTGRFFP